MGNPELVITVFTDYVCPFCYIGDKRLAALSRVHALSADRRFLEIHPETPPAGMPVSGLGYPPGQWRRMMERLAEMAHEERIPFAAREFTTNSRKTLLLAEAVREEAPETFEALNEKIFGAFFGDAKNIGDDAVLRDLASQAGVPEEIVGRAWTDPAYPDILRRNRLIAAQLGVTGVPTFVIGNRILAGAVSVETLLDAAQRTAPAPPASPTGK